MFKTKNTITIIIIAITVITTIITKVTIVNDKLSVTVLVVLHQWDMTLLKLMKHLSESINIMSALLL